LYSLLYNLWHAVAQLVEALCYKPEGRGSAQPLTEMSTRNISWG